MITFLLLLSVLTGVATGAFIIFYALLTKGLTYLLFWGDPMHTIATLPVWYIYLIPIISIYIVNHLIARNDALKEYGVKEIADAIEANRLVFGIKELLIKTFASALSLASGFAVGNEGPSAAIGAMIAYKLHHFMKLPKEMVRISLSIGASSGIAAIFVSPVTGIMFAIENIAYTFVKNYAGYLMVGSVLAFSVVSLFLESLVFGYSTGKALNYHYLYATLYFIPLMTLFVYFYLGMKDKILFFIRDRIDTHLPHLKKYIVAILPGSIIATIMIYTPFAVFSGHEVVKTLIDNSFHLPLWVIFVIIILRILATTVSLYANAVGGIFIALMSIGALIGYGFGEVVNTFAPWHVETFYFAAIGSAVFMGVIMRLPLTAIVLALETTYDYNVIVPTGLAVVLVTWLATLNFDLHKLILKKQTDTKE